MAGELKVSKKISAAFSLCRRGFRALSVNKTGCCIRKKRQQREKEPDKQTAWKTQRASSYESVSMPVSLALPLHRERAGERERVYRQRKAWRLTSVCPRGREKPDTRQIQGREERRNARERTTSTCNRKKMGMLGWLLSL